MKFKAVLFDLDNTLINFLKVKINCVEASVKAMIKAGLKMDFNRAYEQLMKVYFRTGLEYNLIFQEFLKSIGVGSNYKLIAAAIIAYRRTALKTLTPYSGVTSVLKKLRSKGFKIGVVTDANSLKAWMRLTRAGLADFFEFVITSDVAGFKKPHEMPFRLALKRLGVKPEEVLFVGDRLDKDIAGANKVGFSTVLALYGGEVRSPSNKLEEPDFTINRFKDLLRILS